MTEPIIPRDPPRYDCFLEASQHFPDLDPLGAYAFLTLLRVNDLLWGQTNHHFGEHNISQGRFLVMIFLLDKDTMKDCIPLTPAELADMAQVSRASMTGLLDGLEKEGYIRREPDSEDRRMLWVHLEPAGIEKLQAVLPEHFALISRMMQGLSKKEKESLVSILQKLGEQQPVKE